MGLALLRKLFSFLSSLWALADIVLDSVTIINYRAACQVCDNITTPHYPQPCAVRGDQLQLLRPRHPLHVPPRPVRHPLLHGATGQGERGVRVRAGVCPHYHPPLDSISMSTAACPGMSSSSPSSACSTSSLCLLSPSGSQAATSSVSAR